MTFALVLVMVFGIVALSWLNGRWLGDWLVNRAVDLWIRAWTR